MLRYFLFAWSAALAWPCLADGAAAERPYVLVLDSQGPRDSHSAPIIHGLHERLAGRRDARLAVEHLSLAEHGETAEHIATIADVIEHRYGYEQVAAIVTIGDPALRLALLLRDEALGSAPIVFLEVALSSRDADDFPNAAGYVVRHEFERLLKLIAEQRPNARTLHVLDDQIWRSDPARRDFVDATSRLGLPFALNVIEDFDPARPSGTLAALDPDDAALLLSLTIDPGAADETEIVAAIAEASGAPVYGVYERMVGLGLIGGYLKDLRELGDEAGRRVAALLDGARIDQFPAVAEAPHRYVFDFRQLGRFGLTEGDLPDGSVVLHEPDTFYYRYRGYVWLAAAVFGALLVYVFELQLSIRRRIRVERGLETLLAHGDRGLFGLGRDDLVAEVLGRISAVAPFLVPRAALRAPDVALMGAEAAPKYSELFAEAARNGHVAKDGRRAAVAFGETGFPVSFAAFEGRRAPDRIDMRLINLAARDVEHAFAREETVRLTTSLRTAAAIQTAMLPTDFDALGARYGVGVNAMLRPATEVGGDLYDVIAIDDDRLCFVIGDVSGKGVPSALLMAITQTAIRAAAETARTPAEVLAKANALIARDNSEAMFVTAFLAIYDAKDRLLRYANAGHNPPLFRSATGGWEMMTPDVNLALGVLPEFPFVEGVVAAPPGSALLLYTDGVTEAQDISGTLLGEARLVSVAATSERRDPLPVVLAAVDAFAGEAEQYDDITLMSLAFHGG